MVYLSRILPFACACLSDTKTRMDIIAYTDDENMLFRPCVDCGQIIGSYCDGLELQDGAPCLAGLHIPSETWAAVQRTPLCTQCERKVMLCRFCRGVSGCTPPTWRNDLPPFSNDTDEQPSHSSGEPQPSKCQEMSPCLRDIYCGICDMWLNGPEQYAGHAMKQKHQKNLRQNIARASEALKNKLAVDQA